MQGTRLIRRASILCGIVASLPLIKPVLLAQEASGTPIKFISSCEIDLNADKRSDIALSIEDTRGTELVVLLATPDGYSTIVLSRGHSAQTVLGCKFAATVTETVAGPGRPRPRTVRTPGTFLTFSQPEGASIAYVWDGKKFIEVFTAD